MLVVVLYLELVAVVLPTDRADSNDSLALGLEMLHKMSTFKESVNIFKLNKTQRVHKLKTPLDSLTRISSLRQTLQKSSVVDAFIFLVVVSLAAAAVVVQLPPLQRGRQLCQPERQLALEGRVSGLVEAPERRLALQHQVRRVRTRQGKRVLDRSHWHGIRTGFQALRDLFSVFFTFSCLSMRKLSTYCIDTSRNLSHSAVQMTFHMCPFVNTLCDIDISICFAFQ